MSYPSYFRLFQGPSNSAVVRRTWGILEGADANTRVWAYGPHFRYEEFMQTPGVISAIVTSLVIYLGFGLLVSFLIFRGLWEACRVLSMSWWIGFLWSCQVGAQEIWTQAWRGTFCCRSD